MRLQKLRDDGRLISEGNLKYMRFSEVKLALYYVVAVEVETYSAI